MISVLDTEISLFKDYDTAKNPVTVTMLSFLRSEKYAKRVDQIRAIENKEYRNELKATLPACTPSGTFTYRSAKNLVRHSGLLQVDIDRGENEELLQSVDLREALADLPYIAYCGLSVSGRGYWALVPLAYPEKHTQQFAAIEREFAGYGITLDTKPKNVASLRGYSYDRDAYYNHEATPYTHCYEEPTIAPLPVPRVHVGPVADPFGVATRTLEKQGIFYTTGNRHTYLWQFARLCNRLGVSRDECKAYVDGLYGYNERTNWLDSYKRYATEAGSYQRQESTTTQPTATRSIKPVPKLCNPVPYRILETVSLSTGVITNQLSSNGRYPASWDN